MSIVIRLHSPLPITVIRDHIKNAMIAIVSSTLIPIARVRLKRSLDLLEFGKPSKKYDPTNTLIPLFRTHRLRMISCWHRNDLLIH